MRLYAITLIRGEDEFPIGHHPGTRGEAMLKAKYAAKRLGTNYVFDETSLPRMSEWKDLGNTEVVLVVDIGPANHQEDYVRGGRE